MQGSNHDKNLHITQHCLVRLYLCISLTSIILMDYLKKEIEQLFELLTVTPSLARPLFIL